MTVYNVFEARDSLSHLISESERGADVVIARRGKPVARVVPYEDSRSAMTGSDFAQWLDKHPLPMRLRSSMDDIEARVHENRDSWE
ncbi:MAG: type II toxin-antitoxin system Phd/YefM family antitoxin [Ancrocorticia sp.]|uniref:type II toxin-antitoxin system Phd/YefM family antitoxin n=1 Tax=Ancrocorticia sp. TaxID=2593684 RepID=UPI003F923083